MIVVRLGKEVRPQKTTKLVMNFQLCGSSVSPGLESKDIRLDFPTRYSEWEHKGTPFISRPGNCKRGLCTSQWMWKISRVLFIFFHSHLAPRESHCCSDSESSSDSGVPPKTLRERNSLTVRPTVQEHKNNPLLYSFYPSCCCLGLGADLAEQEN